MNATRLIAAALFSAALVACTGPDEFIGSDPGSDPDTDSDSGIGCVALGWCEPLPADGTTTPTPTTPQPWDPPALVPWPGADATSTVDPDGEFHGNMSDLFYERGAGAEPDALWAVQNGPSRLYRMTPDAAGVWRPVVTRALRFPDGGGEVDAEGVTRAELGSTSIYVASERDNADPTVSRLSVLRYDTSATDSTIAALQEWDLTNDLPEVYANAGWEALTWVPDTFLVAQGFVDETTGETYRPAMYPDHGTGLFFLGLEANGLVYVYALDHAGGSFTRIASFESGHESIMSLAFDRDVGYLWSQCDNGCDNQVDVLAIDPSGVFAPRGQFERPATMDNLNNEGIAFAPESRCENGRRAFFWVDDGNAGGHALRADSIPCGAFLP
jgi:hypothetical protein